MLKLSVLTISEQLSKNEIYSKEFAGHAIYQLMDFGQLDLPVEQPIVEIRGPTGGVITVLTFF